MPLTRTDPPVLRSPDPLLGKEGPTRAGLGTRGGGSPQLSTGGSNYVSAIEYLVNGSEDEEYLTRLTEEQAADYLNRPTPA